MILNTFISDFSEALADDEATDTWCQAAYGRALRIYLNYDIRKPPTENDCPCVCVFPSRKRYGGSTYVDVLEVVAMVYDETVTVDEGYPNIVAYPGVTNVEALRRLVLAVVTQAVEGAGAEIEEIDVEYDTISQFPFITVAMAITINEPWTLGAGDPALNQ